MTKYTLTQIVKTLEKLFKNGIDTEQKIKALKWENLKMYSPLEKSLIMDLQVAISKKKIVPFLAGKDLNEGGDNNDRTL